MTIIHRSTPIIRGGKANVTQPWHKRSKDPKASKRKALQVHEVVNAYRTTKEANFKESK